MSDCSLPFEQVYMMFFAQRELYTHVHMGHAPLKLHTVL